MKFYSFDLQLESFGVDPDEFKEVVTTRIFNTFVELWEVKNHKKNTVWLSRSF